MNAETAGRGCPSFEQVSEWVDRGGPGEAGEHLASCPRCQATAAAYRRVNEGVRQAAAVPPGLAERIKAHCRNLPAESSPLPWLFPALRLAAAVVAVAAAVGVLGYSISRQTTPGAAPGPDLASAQTPPASSLPPPAVMPPPPPPLPPGAQPPGPASPALPLSPREVALTDAAGATGSTAPPTASLPLTIPSRVRHVWVVGRDLEASRRLLLANLPQGARCLDSDRAGDLASVRVDIPDHLLPTMVTWLADQGWSLVSPDAPQPGTRGARLLGRHHVVYEARLVPQP